MNINKFKIYSFLEIYQLIKYSIGNKLIASVPTGLKVFHKKIDSLYSEGVKIKKLNDFVVFEYKINNLPFIFSIRKASSDLFVFHQIIKKKEYQIIVDFFKTNRLDMKLVIDAGANIGLTSVFLKAHFPNAKIIALEPSEDTFKRLGVNLKNNNLTDIITLKKGLWGRSTHLSPETSFRDGLDWAFRLIETSDRDDYSIEVVSIFDIVQQFNLELIDFLKIDIEGGEVSVFNNKSNLDWLKKVKVLALEIHDEFNCRIDIENTLINFGFSLSHSKELTIGINKELLPSKTL